VKHSYVQKPYDWNSSTFKQHCFTMEIVHWWARRWRSFAHPTSHPTSEYFKGYFFVQKQTASSVSWALIDAVFLTG
jgi:hypothetical protein